jgi:hypothetical protein
VGSPVVRARYPATRSAARKPHRAGRRGQRPPRKRVISFNPRILGHGPFSGAIRGGTQDDIPPLPHQDEHCQIPGDHRPRHPPEPRGQEQKAEKSHQCRDGPGHPCAELGAAPARGHIGSTGYAVAGHGPEPVRTPGFFGQDPPNIMPGPPLVLAATRDQMNQRPASLYSRETWAILAWSWAITGWRAER